MTGRQNPRNKGQKRNNGKRTQQQTQNDLNSAQNSENENMTPAVENAQPEVNKPSGSANNRKKLKTSNPNVQETLPKPPPVPVFSAGMEGPKGINSDTADDNQNLDPNVGKTLDETDDQFINFNKNELYTVTLDVTNVQNGSMLRALKQIKEFLNQNDISYLNNNNRFFVKKKKGETKKELFFTLDKDNLTKIQNLTYANTYNQTNGESGETTEFTEELKFIHYEKPSNKPSDAEKTNIDSRTLQVFNIPVEVNRDQIINSMKKFGTIVNTRINMTKLYQSAYITYENQDSIAQFYAGKWSTFIGKHNVGATPVNISQEQRDLRREFGVKLSGFKPGTTGFDILPLLQNFNIKYCFFPRNAYNNSPRNYAFVYFQNDEDMGVAIDNTLKFENRELFWYPVETQVCYKCGRDDHIVSECTSQPPKKINRNQLLKQFKDRRTSHVKPNRSYADAMKSNSRTNYSRQQNNNPRNRNPYTSYASPPNLTSKPKTQISDERFAEITNRLERISRQFNLVKNEQQSIKDEIKAINNRKTSTNPTQMQDLQSRADSSEKSIQIISNSVDELKNLIKDLYNQTATNPNTSQTPQTSHETLRGSFEDDPNLMDILH